MNRARIIAGIAAAAVCCTGTVISASAVSANHRPHRTTTTRAVTTTVPASAPTAPTNLRVTALTPTSVTFQWDHPPGATTGCTLPIFLYYVYVDGTLRGSTYLGSPVSQVGNLQPGSTHALAVQGRDNCSGRMSPLSAPLTVTTPA